MGKAVIQRGIASSLQSWGLFRHPGGGVEPAQSIRDLIGIRFPDGVVMGPDARDQILPFKIAQARFYFFSRPSAAT